MGVRQVEREWLELVTDLMADPPDVLPDERIALALCRTFGLTACSYTDMEPDGWGALRLWPGDEQLGGLRDELTEWSMRHAPQQHPLLRYYLHTGRRVPLQIVDVPDRIAGPRVRGGWADIGRAVGAEHQLSIPLRLGAGRHRAFVLGRTEVFGPQEMEFGHLLWRLLTGLDRQLDALSRARLDRAAAADLRLTPREQAVLDLLVDGLTAGAIGRRLAVSERTVHKHLEHVYAKLGVADRLSAVLRAQHLGVLAG